MSRITGALALKGMFAGLAMAGAAAAEPPQAPAPLGVFGADMPAAGKMVFTLAPSFARMQGGRIGTEEVSPDYIVSNIVSPDTPVGAHLLRLIPKDLTVDTQAFNFAYGLTRDVTLAASTAAVEKAVNMEAFKGLAGLTPLGAKFGRTEGLGDSTLAAIVRVHHDPVNRLNFTFGLSLPTGSTTDKISLLLPSNTAPAKRGFYAMQPGSGTVDALPGAAYSGVAGAWSWGLAYRARLPLDRNDQGWRYGDLHEFNGWSGYSWPSGLEATFRINATTQGAIQGEDPGIRGFAQGSNPLFYGGQQVSLYGGLIVGGHAVGLDRMQFGLEAGAPVYQRLNGPQLGRDWQLNFALRYKR